MFEIVDDIRQLEAGFRAAGLEAALERGQRVLIKINLARPPLPRHPRTDAALLRAVLSYLLRSGTRPVLCESVAGSSLRDNLAAIGVLDFVNRHDVGFFNIDGSPTVSVTVDGETHYLPVCFGDYPVRIALPCASRREGMLFSNNVKLFIGAVPREHYMRPGEGQWRSKIHDHLDRSVRNVYLAFARTCPFHFYINGGNSYWDKRGGFTIDKTFIGTDALELDMEIISRYFDVAVMPEYLRLLAAGCEGPSSASGS
jgi:hypothetical protein